MKASKLEKAFAWEIAMKFIDYYYSYLTSTKMEDVENMEEMDILTPIYGTG